MSELLVRGCLQSTQQKVPGRVGLYVALTLLVGACASPQGVGSSAGGEAVGRGSGAPRRIVAAIQGDAHNLSARVDPTGINTPGLDALEELISSGLVTHDNEGRLHPRLSESVPTLENGLWSVQPDGRMETRWTIRSGARWHDGTPVTAADFLFTAQVDQDREIVAIRNLAYDSIESLEAPDERTLIARWSRPYIEADTLFGRSAGPPFPRHLLERPYLDDKSSFAQLPYWSSDFIGSGPYRVKEFARGSHLLLVAFEDYVPGRPKVDEIELRIIVDTNTLMANVLAGTVELTLGRSISLEQGLQLRDQWKEGKLDISYQSWIMFYPQFLNPSPAVVGDVRFRRALMHAIDRQEMSDTLNFGIGPVAHAYLSPNEPEYKDLEGSMVRYEYDTRKATQMIEGLGFAKGPDGALRDSEGRRLAVEIRVSARNPLSNKSQLAVTDYWQQIGVGADPLVIPTQRAADREYVANFPAFHLYRQPNDIHSVKRYHSSQSRTAERNYVGNNYNRYMSPEFDTLIDHYFATIARAERTQVLGQILYHMTDQLLLMGLFHDVEATMISKRITNVGARYQNSTQAWNAHQWEVRN